MKSIGISFSILPGFREGLFLLVEVVWLEEVLWGVFVLVEAA